MNTIEVSKEELLEVLKTNKATHQSEYESAYEGYVVKASEALDKMKQDLLAGKKSGLYFDLPEPQNYVEHYDLAIEMLEMDKNQLVTLSVGDFKQYVKDQWAWKEGFTLSNSAYR